MARARDERRGGGRQRERNGESEDRTEQAATHGGLPG